MNHPALDISSLTIKRSRSFSLSIDRLALQPGQTACLVGANGSGKSTLLEAVAGIIPSGSAISICGETQDSSSPSPRRRLGYIPDDDNWIIPELTAGEYFRLLSAIHTGTVGSQVPPAAKEIGGALSFSDYDSQMRLLSHGNRKKVQIIAALFPSPDLLIVDELRNGLDPLVIREAEALLEQRAAAGCAILAATHDLWWAERFAERAIIIRNGSVILDESIENIVTASGSLEARLTELYQLPAHV